MTRRKRIALELLGPALIGSILLMLWLLSLALITAFREQQLPELDSQIFLGIAWIVVAAYILAGVPSVIYTLFMEWRIKRGLNPCSWLAVAWSTFLGFLSGAAIVTCISGFRWDSTTCLAFGVLGTGAGFILGMFIKCSSVSEAP